MADIINNSLNSVASTVGITDSGGISKGSKVLIAVAVVLAAASSYGLYHLLKPKNKSMAKAGKQGTSGGASNTKTSSNTNTTPPASKQTQPQAPAQTQSPSIPAPTPAQVASTFGDGTTDFTNMDVAPWAAWVAPLNNLKVGADQNIGIKKGATVTLYDTNLSDIGTATNNSDPDTNVGTVWGLNSAYALIKLFDFSTNPDFPSASFIGVAYKDIPAAQPKTGILQDIENIFSADGRNDFLNADGVRQKKYKA